MDIIHDFAKFFQNRLKEFNKLMNVQAPKIFGVSALKMKDANFSAEAFIENGKRKNVWQKRKKETKLSEGKSILSGRDHLRKAVKFKTRPGEIEVGVDLNVIPYAQIHNEGGKTGRNHAATMPASKYLGYTPDIEKIAMKEIKHLIEKILK